jgi:hypothetical protein
MSSTKRVAGSASLANTWNSAVKKTAHFKKKEAVAPATPNALANRLDASETSAPTPLVLPAKITDARVLSASATIDQTRRSARKGDRAGRVGSHRGGDLARRRDGAGDVARAEHLPGAQNRGNVMNDVPPGPRHIAVSRAAAAASRRGFLRAEVEVLHRLPHLRGVRLGERLLRLGARESQNARPVGLHRRGPLFLPPPLRDALRVADLAGQPAEARAARARALQHGLARRGHSLRGLARDVHGEERRHRKSERDAAHDEPGGDERVQVGEHHSSNREVQAQVQAHRSREHRLRLVRLRLGPSIRRRIGQRSGSESAGGVGVGAAPRRRRVAFAASVFFRDHGARRTQTAIRTRRRV